jgi:hypothetical protein
MLVRITAACVSANFCRDFTLRTDRTGPVAGAMSVQY